MVSHLNKKVMKIKIASKSFERLWWC